MMISLRKLALNDAFNVFFFKKPNLIIQHACTAYIRIVFESYQKLYKYPKNYEKNHDIFT